MRRIQCGVAVLILLAMTVSIAAFGEGMGDMEMPMPMDVEAPRLLTATELINMIYDPENAAYLGKTIQVSGYYDAVRGVDHDTVTYYLIMAEPGSCCAESITFIPDVCCEAFPESGTVVDLTGRLELMEKDGRKVLHLVDALLSWE